MLKDNHLVDTIRRSLPLLWLTVHQVAQTCSLGWGSVVSTDAFAQVILLWGHLSVRITVLHRCLPARIYMRLIGQRDEQERPDTIGLTTTGVHLSSCFSYWKSRCAATGYSKLCDAFEMRRRSPGLNLFNFRSDTPPKPLSRGGPRNGGLLPNGKAVSSSRIYTCSWSWSTDDHTPLSYYSLQR